VNIHNFFVGLRPEAPKNTGKWYWEDTATAIDANGGSMCGVADASLSLTIYLGSSSLSVGWEPASGGGNYTLWYNDSSTVYAGSGPMVGHVMAMCLDIGRSKI
jgi:hypothetical protein